MWFTASYNPLYETAFQVGGRAAKWGRESDWTERYQSPYNIATAVCNSLSNLSTLSRPVVGIMPPSAAA
jgi:hypothetical protein